MDNKQPLGLDRARRKAEELLKDKESTGRLVEAALVKADRHKTALVKVRAELGALFRLLKAWARGDYREVPWKSIVLAAAAIIYFLNPFDIVPDWIPLVGYMDDATVIGFVAASIKKDIDRFLEWEKG
ncbi:MAG: DUF1232 domain-containing protein [Thermodesulfobacteriota bacterium]